jgi:DNA-binding NarL/FixJ family response regulator
MRVARRGNNGGVNILIVEDNRHMRRMLIELVGTAFQRDSISEAPDGATALSMCRELRPQLILMDVGLPDSNGVQLTAQIRALLPQSKVMIVTSHTDRVCVEAAHRAGAIGYVIKDEVYEKLLPALSRVVDQLHEEREEIT